MISKITLCIICLYCISGVLGCEKTDIIIEEVGQLENIIVIRSFFPQSTVTTSEGIFTVEGIPSGCKSVTVSLKSKTNGCSWYLHIGKSKQGYRVL